MVKFSALRILEIRQNTTDQNIKFTFTDSGSLFVRHNKLRLYFYCLTIRIFCVETPVSMAIT